MSRLTVYRGDDKTYNLTFKDSHKRAIDISSWTIFFTVKESESDIDDDAKIQKDVTSHTDAENGLSAITITDSDTDLTVKEYYYDIQVKKDDGSIKTIVKDKFVVLRDITRRIS